MNLLIGIYRAFPFRPHCRVGHSLPCLLVGSVSTTVKDRCWYWQRDQWNPTGGKRRD